MFASFRRRSIQAEMMDDQSTPYDAFRDCLRDLEKVNHLTLAYRPAARWLRQAFAHVMSSRPVSIIDVGSGGGDTLRFIARRAKHRGRAVDLTGVDLNVWSRQYAERETPPGLAISFETSDIFSFDPARQADFIISSLFTHHLDDGQLVRFLGWMERHARHGWFINDLHRHPVAYIFFKYAARLLRFHPMVRHDGPISIARAFSKKDWLQALAAAQIPIDQVAVRWAFPFRYCLTRFKP